MKKKVLLSMALLSIAATAGSTPITSYAAEKYVFNATDQCYKVYVGQGVECLSQILTGLGITLENNGIFCPNTGLPDAVPPEVSDDVTLSYAEQVVKLVNEERDKAGLPALNMDVDITAAANVRAKEIKQKFSHTRPNGSSFSSVLREHGVSFMGSGENIAWGQRIPEQVMNAWMNSDGHRANILNKNFKNIGVGYYQDENGTKYWVQLFSY